MEQTVASQSPTTIVVLGKQKSVGVAFILAFLFGPLGLLYASILGGLIMMVVGVIAFFVLPVIGGIFAWIVSIIWTIVAASRSHTKIHQSIR